MSLSIQVGPRKSFWRPFYPFLLSVFGCLFGFPSKPQENRVPSKTPHLQRLCWDGRIQGPVQLGQAVPARLRSSQRVSLNFIVGCGSKKHTQNGTLLNGSKDQNLPSPGALNLTHTQLEEGDMGAALVEVGTPFV